MENGPLRDGYHSSWDPRPHAGKKLLWTMDPLFVIEDEYTEIIYSKIEYVFQSSI